MNIYQEQILEHYKDPQNYGELKNATHRNCALNPTCGDKICIDLHINQNIIQEISFNGSGCAISQATASMLTEKVKGQTIDYLTKIDKDDILKMLEIELSMNRLKCGVLALEASHRALNNPLKEIK